MRVVFVIKLTPRQHGGGTGQSNKNYQRLLTGCAHKPARNRAAPSLTGCAHKRERNRAAPSLTRPVCCPGCAAPMRATTRSPCCLTAALPPEHLECPATWARAFQGCDCVFCRQHVGAVGHADADGDPDNESPEQQPAVVADAGGLPLPCGWLRGLQPHSVGHLRCLQEWLRDFAFAFNGWLCYLQSRRVACYNGAAHRRLGSWCAHPSTATESRSSVLARAPSRPPGTRPANSGAVEATHGVLQPGRNGVSQPLLPSVLQGCDPALTGGPAWRGLPEHVASLPGVRQCRAQ